MFKIIKFFFIINIILLSHVLSEENFNDWVKSFKLKAVNSGISQNVVEEVMLNVKFLPKVIEYDRYQPEFYEDTFTYIKKELQKIAEGKKLYKKKRILLIKLKKILTSRKNYY